MHAIQLSRGSSGPSQARRAARIAAGVAAAIFAAVVVVVALGVRGVDASPPAVAAVAASGHASVETPGRDPSLPSAKAVFDVQTMVVPDELPATF